MLCASRSSMSLILESLRMRRRGTEGVVASMMAVLSPFADSLTSSCTPGNRVRSGGDCIAAGTCVGETILARPGRGKTDALPSKTGFNRGILDGVESFTVLCSKGFSWTAFARGEF